jgi:hypothetical protein
MGNQVQDSVTCTETVTTWRGFAGQLTAAQQARYVQRDRLYGDGPGWQRLLIDQARAEVADNRVDAQLFPTMEEPAGVSYLDHWQLDAVDGKFFRYFDGRRWHVGDLDAVVLGTQHADGRIECAVQIESRPSTFDAAQLREIAAALIEAAADLDRIE